MFYTFPSYKVKATEILCGCGGVGVCVCVCVCVKSIFLIFSKVSFSLKRENFLRYQLTHTETSKNYNIHRI